MQGTDEKNNIDISDSSLVQSQLDKALNRLDNQNQSGEVASKTEEQVFMQRQDLEKLKKDKKKYFKDLGWYWKLIKKPVLFLAGLEILVYVLAVVDNLEGVMMGIVDPLLLVVDFIVFTVLIIKVKRKKRETLRQGIVTLFLSGFGLGFVMAIFRLFWIREFWTIFNLIVEPVFMGLVAGVVGLVVGLFVKRKRIP